jgi:hypothetical protein
MLAVNSVIQNEKFSMQKSEPGKLCRTENHFLTLISEF